jgi:hypothetical protein
MAPFVIHAEISWRKGDLYGGGVHYYAIWFYGLVLPLSYHDGWVS